MALDDDGGRLAVGLFDTSVEVWRIAEGASVDDIHLATARGDVDRVRALVKVVCS